MTAPDINISEITGRLVRESYYFAVDDVSVCRLLVAVQGKYRENCINVIVVGDNAEMGEHLQKDGRIAVVGRLERYVREDEHEFHEYVFIVANSVYKIAAGSKEKRKRLEAKDGKQVDFEDLPPEVRTLISERIAELTEQGL
jgi:single-stranded DNA-binding protein